MVGRRKKFVALSDKKGKGKCTASNCITEEPVLAGEIIEH